MNFCTLHEQHACMAFSYNLLTFLFAGGLQVSLKTTPPGPFYTVASFVRINCTSTGGLPPLQYQIRHYCSKTNQYLGGWSLSSVLRPTTPAHCGDQYLCRVTDVFQNTETAVITISQLTGMRMSASCSI